MPRASSRSSPVAAARSAIASSSSSAASAGSSRRLAARQPQRQRQADEPLLRAVVQVALEPRAGRVGGVDDPRARRAQLRLGPPARGDVAQVADEQRRAGLGDPRDRELAGELLAVAAHRRDLDAAVEHDRRRPRERPGQAGAVGGAQVRRHDQLGHLAARAPPRRCGRTCARRPGSSPRRRRGGPSPRRSRAPRRRARGSARGWRAARPARSVSLGMVGATAPPYVARRGFIPGARRAPRRTARPWARSRGRRCPGRARRTPPRRASR